MSRLVWFVSSAWMLTACAQGRWDRDPDPYDLDFDVPRTEAFADSLSAYELYEEPLASLQPTERVLPYELSSELFTDYAHKQRLMMVPEGTSVTFGDRAVFPEGTVLVKTFSYPLDMRDSDSPQRLIETRLLVKTEGVWNAATYLWNAEQTDATLLLDGTTTEVTWIDEAGESWTTDYAVPHEGECVTCHQLDGASAYIGPTLQNLNRTVRRDDADVDQLAYLQSEGVLASGDSASVAEVVDFRDVSQPLERRARAYLDINCAHCHNPGGWDEASQRDIDFRHGTPLRRTGLERQADELPELLEEGEMPFLGTTLLHTEGIELVLDFASSL